LRRRTPARPGRKHNHHPPTTHKTHSTKTHAPCAARGTIDGTWRTRRSSVALQRQLARDRFGGTARCGVALECAWAHLNRSASSLFLSSLKLYTGQVHTHTSATSDSGSVRNTTQHVPDACLREESKCVSVMRATSRRGVVCLRCGVLLAALAVKTAICACCLCSAVCCACLQSLFGLLFSLTLASGSRRAPRFDPSCPQEGHRPIPSLFCNLRVNFALNQPRNQHKQDNRPQAWQQTVPVVRGFVRNSLSRNPLVGGADAGSGPWARHCITNTAHTLL